MMKNSIKKLLVGALFVGVGLSATTLEEYNQYIADAKHPDLKQVLRCEREAGHLKSNPEECLKALDMLLKSKKNLHSNPDYRFDFHGETSANIRIHDPEMYKQTNKEFINEHISAAYVNTGVIYSALSQHETEVKMYEKALEYKPNDVITHLRLGIVYYLGDGVEVNKIKAYEHWRVAAKQGNEKAQKFLNILCSESPWACK